MSESEWKLVQEDFVILEPSPPKHQLSVNEQQAKLIEQVWNLSEVKLIADGQSVNAMQVGGQTIEVNEIPDSKGSYLVYGVG